MASLTDLKDIQEAAVRAIRPLLQASPADVVAAFMPREGDYDRVFLPEAAGNARIGYESMWTSPPTIGKPGQTEVEATAVHASAMSGDTVMPGGYKRIAHLLVPDQIWVAFKTRAPGQSAGMAYDGLVWIDGRFAWFPKAFRVIGETLS